MPKLRSRPFFTFPPWTIFSSLARYDVFSPLPFRVGVVSSWLSARAPAFFLAVGAFPLLFFPCVSISPRSPSPSLAPACELASQVQEPGAHSNLSSLADINLALASSLSLAAFFRSPASPARNYRNLRFLSFLRFSPGLFCPPLAVFSLVEHSFFFYSYSLSMMASLKVEVLFFL